MADDTKNLQVNAQLVYQIKGFNERVAAVELSVAFDASLIPRTGTDVIVNVKLFVPTQIEPIQVTQQLPESSIVKGDINSLSLEGILYIQSAYLEGLQTVATLYYCQ